MNVVKFANRKLYQSKKNGHAGYVNALDLLHALKKGESVSVIDHKTGQDITLVTVLAALAKYPDFSPILIYNKQIQELITNETV